MKKKDPNEEANAKTGVNFVTPAEKSSTVPASSKVATSPAKAENAGDTDFVEQDEGIERLVAHASPETAEASSIPDVVDLTAAPMLTTSSPERAGTATQTKRRKAPKKPPAKASEAKQAKVLFAGVSPTKEVPAASEVAAVHTAQSDENQSVPATDATEEIHSEARENTESTEPEPADTTATNIAAVVTPAPAPKKRARKPTVKKVEATEAAKLDADGAMDVSEGIEAGADAAEADPEASEAAGKPAAKRVRKTPAKPVPAAVVYPPHVEIKLQSNREKIQALLHELLALERYVILWFEILVYVRC